MSDVLAGQIVRAAHVVDHETRIDAIEAGNYGTRLTDIESFGSAYTALTGASGTIAASSYANLPGSSSVTLTKRLASTKLQVDIVQTFYNSGAAGTDFMIGVRIGSTDYDCGSMFHDNTLLRLPCIGYQLIAGIGAGSVTVQGRWKRNSGTGTGNVIGSDRFTLRVVEVR